MGFSIWREALIGLALGLAWYGSWKVLTLLVKRENVTRKRTLRYLVPTAMTAGTWAVFLAPPGSAWPAGGPVALLLGSMLSVFILVDAPAWFLSNGVLNVAAAAGLPPLGQGLLGSAAAWLAWFGIIRFGEWRTEANAPVSLGITGGISEAFKLEQGRLS